MFLRTGWTDSTFSFSLHTHSLFSVTILRCHKDVYFNSFFPLFARFWNSLLAECFPLTYDLHCFKSKANRNLLSLRFCSVLFLNTFHRFLLFLVTPSLVVVVQPFMEWIPDKKNLPLPHSWKLDLAVICEWINENHNIFYKRFCISVFIT